MSDPGDKSGNIYDSGLRNDIESNRGTTDIGTGHQTQVYPDNQRVSRDEFGPWHWTNQNLPKGDDSRHTPPPDYNNGG